MSPCLECFYPGALLYCSVSELLVWTASKMFTRKQLFPREAIQVGFYAPLLFISHLFPLLLPSCTTVHLLLWFVLTTPVMLSPPFLSSFQGGSCMIRVSQCLNREMLLERREIREDLLLPDCQQSYNK